MESIRLTNDELIDQLTFDKSDSFYWLKEQARRGVVSAQVIDIILKLINSKPSLQFSKD
jgi:hypothetical protein